MFPAMTTAADVHSTSNGTLLQLTCALVIQMNPAGGCILTYAVLKNKKGWSCMVWR